IEVTRTVSLYTVNAPPPTTITVDLAAAGFLQIAPGPFPFNPALSLPPAGSCTVIEGSDNFLTSAFPNPFIKGTLNAGASLTVPATKGSRTVSLPPTGGPAQLGKNIPGTNLSNSLILDPGSIRFSSAGGADVGAIQASLTNPAAIAWTNRDQIAVINRSQSLT